MSNLVPTDRIEESIYLVRGQKVLLDSDLARLYGVKTKELNKAVKRNKERFPADFAFQLTHQETVSLRFQFGTSNTMSTKEGRGGRRYLPYVFTEQGVAMLSSVLKSRRAALVNVEIMRTFVKLRRFLATNRELARKLEELEKRYDAKFREVFDAIRKLMKPKLPLRRPTGLLPH